MTDKTLLMSNNSWIVVGELVFFPMMTRAGKVVKIESVLLTKSLTYHKASSSSLSINCTSGTRSSMRA